MQQGLDFAHLAVITKNYVEPGFGETPQTSWCAQRKLILVFQLEIYE